MNEKLLIALVLFVYSLLIILWARVEEKTIERESTIRELLSLNNRLVSINEQQAKNAKDTITLCNRIL